jgi:hypothetical protein
MPKNPFTGVTNEARQAGADKRAADLVPIVRELRAAGVTSLRGIAAASKSGGFRPRPAVVGSLASATAAGAATGLDARPTAPLPDALACRQDARRLRRPGR